MRKALSLGLVAVVAAGAFAPAVAAPKKPKPITQSYTANGIPFPLSGTSPTDIASSCANPSLEGISTTTKSIKTVGAGVLSVEMTGFFGDWDITILDKAGAVIAAGDNAAAFGTAMSTGDIVERALVKFKKAQEIRIAVCNFGGGPTANVKFTYTYK